MLKIFAIFYHGERVQFRETKSQKLHFGRVLFHLFLRERATPRFTFTFRFGKWCHCLRQNSSCRTLLHPRFPFSPFHQLGTSQSFHSQPDFLTYFGYGGRQVRQGIGGGRQGGPRGVCSVREGAGEAPWDQQWSRSVQGWWFSCYCCRYLCLILILVKTSSLFCCFHNHRIVANLIIDVGYDLFWLLALGRCAFELLFHSCGEIGVLVWEIKWGCQKLCFITMVK